MRARSRSGLHLLNSVIDTGRWVDEGEVIAMPAAVLGDQMSLDNSRMPALQHAELRHGGQSDA